MLSHEDSLIAESGNLKPNACHNSPFRSCFHSKYTKDTPPPAILVGTPNSGDRPQLWVLTRGSGKNKPQLPESPLGLGKTKQNLARAIAGNSIDAPSKPPPAFHGRLLAGHGHQLHAVGPKKQLLPRLGAHLDHSTGSSHPPLFWIGRGLI